MDIQIKQIQASDLDQCLYVIHASFATVVNEFKLTEQNCPKHPAFMKIELLQNRINKRYLMFGLYEREQLVGYISLSNPEKHIIELHNLSVLPEFRHKGYGKQILDFCKAKTKELNCDIIKIDIIEDNIILKNWYLKYGFVQTSSMKYENLPFTVGFMELMVPSEGFI